MGIGKNFFRELGNQIMHRYIPHKNNSHSWRTLLFIFFVMLISAGGAYFANSHSGIFQKNVSAKEAGDTQSIKEDVASNAIVPIVETAVAESIAQPVEMASNELMEKKEPFLPPIERSKNPATRQDEAKMYTKPQILTGKYIDISLKYQNMVIFENGEALDAYIVSSGMRGMETPVGTFKIENKSPRAWSKKYSLWMPNWMAFLPSGEMGIHELPVWPGGYQEGANHLGIPVSHGCVRLGPAPAKRVYDWAEIGTPVIIHK